MSFRRDYVPLFSVRLLDDDGESTPPGVAIRPTSRSARTLADHQLLWRTRPYGIEVFYTLNPWDAAPVLAPITARVQLDFSLRLPAGFFADHLPDLGEPRHLHLYNLDASGTVRPGARVGLSRAARVAEADLIRLLPGRFEMPFGIPPGATRFEVRGQFDDTLLLDIPAEDLERGKRLTFDLRILEPGRFRLAVDSLPAQQTALLLDNEVAASTAQGLVSIVLDRAQDLAPAGGYRFEARFETR